MQEAQIIAKFRANTAGCPQAACDALLRALIDEMPPCRELMRLATAVGTPVVALFGPTVEAFGFSPYHAKAAVLQRELPCRPCSSHGTAACPLKHHRCLQDLQPDQVLEALRRLPR